MQFINVLDEWSLLKQAYLEKFWQNMRKDEQQTQHNIVVKPTLKYRNETEE